MSNLLKNLIIALGITIVIGIVYMLTIGSGSEGDVSFESIPQGNSEISARNEKILRDTQEISTYEMDVSIFTDSRFISLKDYHVDVEDVETGRTNPFAPIE